MSCAGVTVTTARVGRERHLSGGSKQNTKETLQGGNGSSSSSGLGWLWLRGLRTTGDLQT